MWRTVLSSCLRTGWSRTHPKVALRLNYSKTSFLVTVLLWRDVLLLSCCHQLDTDRLVWKAIFGWRNCVIWITPLLFNWPRWLCVRRPRWRLQCVAGHCCYHHSVFFSLSLFSVFCFWPTSGNLPRLNICFPQYFGITRRYMQKKYLLGRYFYFLWRKKMIFLCVKNKIYKKMFFFYIFLLGLPNY